MPADSAAGGKRDRPAPVRRPNQIAVHESDDRVRVDAGSGVGGGDPERLAASDGTRRQPERRWGHVVHPEPERERARAAASRAVEDDGVVTARGRERARREHRLLELARVRVVVDRKPGVARQAVLVEAGDDARLDAAPTPELGDDDPEVRDPPAETQCEHALRPSQRRVDADAARRLRIAVPGHGRCLTRRRASVEARLAESERLVPREAVGRHASPHRNPSHVRSASQLDVRVEVARG